MINETAERELFKTTLTKNGQTFNYIPMTERVRALREWPEYKGYAICTSYEIINHEMVLGDQFITNHRCVVRAEILDPEGRTISCGLDSCPYFFTSAKEPTKLQEDGDFCAKAESGAISRALQNLGIALPTKEELQAKEEGKNGKKGYTSATGNTRTPGAPAAPFQPQAGNQANRTDDSKLIEKYTGRTVADLRKNGGEVIEFQGRGQYQLKYNPDKASYYWSNIDKSVTTDKYISTTVSPIE